MKTSIMSRLAKRQKLNNLRFLRRENELVDFASNDYLGISRSEQLRFAIAGELKKHPSLNSLGSTGSRLLTGNTCYAEELEAKIAAFHGCEAGLLFSCGYMANVGLLSAIATSKDVIIYDTHVHASMHDGIQLSNAKAYPFRHNDLSHLENRLKKRQKGCFVCIESVYSIDGSFAPLKDISELCKKYEAYLIVDEAHAGGIFGPSGKGLSADKSIDAFAKVITFGKAFGTFGAIVLGSAVLKKCLLNFARSCIYTTALPPLSLAAIKCAYDIMPSMNQERDYLHRLISHFQKRHPQNPLSPIQPIAISGNSRAKEFSHLFKQ